MTRYAPTYWALIQHASVRQATHVVLADDYGRTLTGRELHDEACRAAAGLAAQGVGRGTVVSWQIPSVLEAIVLMAALARLDAVQNPIIPILREREVGFITRQVGTQYFVTPETWRGFGHGALARGVGAEVGFATIGLDLSGDPRPGTMRLPAGDVASLPPVPSAEGRDGVVEIRFWNTSRNAADSPSTSLRSERMMGDHRMETLLASEWLKLAGGSLKLPPDGSPCREFSLVVPGDPIHG